MGFSLGAGATRAAGPAQRVPIDQAPARPEPAARMPPPRTGGHAPAAVRSSLGGLVPILRIQAGQHQRVRRLVRLLYVGQDSVQINTALSALTQRQCRHKGGLGLY